jgi:hypothetical protein
VNEAVAVGVPVAVVLAMFEVIKLLIAKTVNGGGQRSVGRMQTTLYEDRATLLISEKMTAISKSLEDIVRMQEKIVEMIRAHELLTSRWLDMGCPKDKRGRRSK